MGLERRIVCMTVLNEEAEVCRENTGSRPESVRFSCHYQVARYKYDSSAVVEMTTEVANVLIRLATLVSSSSLITKCVIKVCQNLTSGW